MDPHIGEFIRLRREIHGEPELAFEEHRTAALVADKLESWGYAVERQIGGTGVVGQLRRGTGTRRIGLRADMDALPILEATGATWASRRPGVMHACGHDGHTARLLAAAFLIESAPSNERGFYGSCLLAAQGAGVLVAGLLGVGLSSQWSPADMLAWGWRVPFLVGLLLLPVALYLRRNMPETLHAETVKTTSVGLAGLGRQRGFILLAVLVIIGGTVSTYVGQYMTTYAITTLKMSPGHAMGATVVGGLSTLAFAVLGGWMCDRIGRKPTMFWPRVAAAVLTVPAFLLLVAQPTPVILYAVTGFLAALTAIGGAASLVTIPELLPCGIRATGMAIAYAVGVSLFGGTTQLPVAWLIGVTGNPAAPAWYVAGASVITALAMLALPESRDRALED